MLTGQASEPLVTARWRRNRRLPGKARAASRVAGRLIRGQAQLRGNPEVIPDPELVRRLSKLTRRERQVLDCILLQKLNKQIAAVRAVRPPSRGIAAGIRTRRAQHDELVVLAIRAGLYPAPRP